VLKPFSCENFVPSKTDTNTAVLGKGGFKFKFCFCDPEMEHLCAKPRLLTYFPSKSVRLCGADSIDVTIKTGAQRVVASRPHIFQIAHYSDRSPNPSRLVREQVLSCPFPKEPMRTLLRTVVSP